jgi:hypothetical protein
VHQHDVSHRLFGGENGLAEEDLCERKQLGVLELFLRMTITKPHSAVPLL